MTKEKSNAPKRLATSKNGTKQKRSSSKVSPKGATRATGSGKAVRGKRVATARTTGFSQRNSSNTVTTGSGAAIKISIAQEPTWHTEEFLAPTPDEQDLTREERIQIVAVIVFAVLALIGALTVFGYLLGRIF